MSSDRLHNETTGYYYAAGRNDADRARWTDPHAFAKFYADWRDEPTYAPSVQDAFRTFRENMPTGRQCDAANDAINALGRLAAELDADYSAVCLDTLNTSMDLAESDTHRWVAELHALAFALNHAMTDRNKPITPFADAARGYRDNIPTA